MPLTRWAVIVPTVEMRLMLERRLLPVSDAAVNQRAPSGPAAIAIGPGTGPERAGRGYSAVTEPAVVIRPILPAFVTGPAAVSIVPPVSSANHSAPSGPAVIPSGMLPEVGMANSVTAPAVV